MKMELFPKKFNAGHWSTQYTSGDMRHMPMLSDLQWSMKKSLSFQNMLFIRKDDTLVTERKRSNNKHMYKLEASRVN